MSRRRSRPFLGTRLWAAHHPPSEDDATLPRRRLREWGIYDRADGGIEDSGASSRPSNGVNGNQKHSYLDSMRTTITNDGGCRSFMNWFLDRGDSTLWFSAWYYFPVTVAWTGHQIMQFKSHDGAGTQDGVAYKLAVKNTLSPMNLRLVWDLGVDAGELGPYAGQNNTGAPYHEDAPIPFPEDKWFNVEVKFKQSGKFGGEMVVWQDGYRIFDYRGVKTKVFGHYNSFSVTNYGTGTNPATVNVYIDDVSIGTGPLRRRV